MTTEQTRVRQTPNSTFSSNVPVTDTFQPVKFGSQTSRKPTKSPDIPLGAVEGEAQGFSKDFLEIAAEASDEEGEAGHDKELRALLKQYEKVDFGKLSAINFGSAPTSQGVHSPKPPQTLPQTADFLFAGPDAPAGGPNNYQPNFNQSVLQSQVSPKGPDSLNTSNAWAKSFGKRSLGSAGNTSQNDSMSQSKVAKKEVIEKEGFLDF